MKRKVILPRAFLMFRVFFKVFFVIRMYEEPDISNLPETTDPDPCMSCDLMDGRDAFLTLARDKHWEFSSLRRAKYSTMCMLFDLHNQGQDRFVYSCNLCKRHVETRYHCSECEVRWLLWSKHHVGMHDGKMVSLAHTGFVIHSTN